MKKIRKVSLAERVIALVENARQRVGVVANLAQVYTNYEIGRQIVEEEQGGKRRAGYGEKILFDLSAKLTARFGSGWSTRNLRYMRQLFNEYSTDKIRQELLAKSSAKDLARTNRLLRCFFVIDLKIGKVTHKDIGQLQMYVHYYDREVKALDENPTIGILLCSDDNRAVVEMTLPDAEKRQIFARRYSAIIPSKERLASIVIEEKRKFEKEKLLALAELKTKGGVK